MKKRLLSLLLILCLCAALLSVAVLAEDGVIDVDKTNITNFRGNSNYKYTFPEGSYRLTGDIQLSADGTLIWLVVEGDVTFDLNGHILRATEGKRFQIDVGSSNMDSHLTLTDSQPDVSHEVDGKTINGGMIYGLRGLPGGAGTSCITVNLGSTLTMQGGSIVSGKIAGSGTDYPDTSGVYVAGTFNMTGGRIIGCSTVSCGGGVGINGGKFNMSGGSIENCHADKDGGGVYVWSGVFNMTGGEIKNCTAGSSGGGVYVDADGKATLITANITDNKNNSGEIDNIVGSYEEYIPPVDPIDPDYPLISILPALAKDLLFIDVKSTDWFYSDVKYAYETGLMTGTSVRTFAPDRPVTRAMLVTILWRLAGEPYGRVSPFEDVLPGSWYAQAVSWAYDKGIVTGVTATSFQRKGPVTREQLCAILCRYAALTGKNTAASASLDAFTDRAQVSAYAEASVRWALQAGLLTGVGDGRLAPRSGATRAQLAVLLQRFAGLK